MTGAAMAIGMANIVTSARNRRIRTKSQVGRLAEDAVGGRILVDRDDSLSMEHL